MNGSSPLADIPIKRHDPIEALIMLNADQESSFTNSTFQFYTSLAEQASTMLEKIFAMQLMERRLSAIETLNTISQAVSADTNLQDLYKTIHKEVCRVMGEVNFLIALYDSITQSIHIPYMVEGGKNIEYDPFPLGEGLASILINTRQPLLLVEDTESKAGIARWHAWQGACS